LRDLPKEITLDTKIDIFDERVSGWKLNIADYLINGIRNEKGESVLEGNPHAGYAVLDIVFNYFEMIAKYREGYLGKSPRKYFKKGLRMVFPVMNKEGDQNAVEELLDKLYSDVRCGIYHIGLTSPSIFLEGGQPAAIGFYRSKRVVINPHQMVFELKRDFNSYISQLKEPNNTILRSNFEKRFDADT
jgi:hypothetical protein